MARLDVPSAANNTMRARLAMRASTVPARAELSSTARSPSLSFNGGSRMTTSNHISVICAVDH